MDMQTKQIQRRAQIIGFFKAGRSRYASFYKWRSKYGGMDATEAKRLRELELENGKLKRLLAEAHLDIHALKSVFGTKLAI